MFLLQIELVDNAAAALDHKAAEDKEIQLAPPEHKEEEPIVNEGGAAVMEPEKKDAVKVMANKVPEEIGQVGALDQDQADQQPKLQAPEGNEDSNQVCWLEVDSSYVFSLQFIMTYLVVSRLKLV